ncbi:NUDIX domain-containing protein [Candidatus Babeliales bacterium]|nr:NUDIX domain-containing protein [Candidatus Babeliales bacterium]
MNKYDTIIIRARALIVDNGHILLTKHQNDPTKTYSFLPGGKVEFGEHARDTLIRELQEELGVITTIKRFLGTGEGIWNKDSRTQHDICLYFEVTCPKLVSTQTPPPCKEDDIEFLWQPISKLKEAEFVPPYAQQSIDNWLIGRYEQFLSDFN